MVEIFRDLLRRDVPAERPLIDRATVFVADHRETFVAYAHSDTLRIGVEMFAGESEITKGGGHKYIGLASALYEIADDFLALGNHVLCRSGNVIDIKGVNVRSMIEEE